MRPGARDVLTATANLVLFAAVMFLGFCAGAFEPECLAARDALCALLRIREAPGVFSD